MSDLRGSLVLWHAWNRDAGRILMRELEGKRPFGRPLVGRKLKWILKTEIWMVWIGSSG
jgi:hypothetical protein